MSKMFGVRLQVEDARRLENIIKKRKTTAQEYLKAVVMGDMERVEKHWFSIGLPWGRKKPYDVRDPVFIARG